MPAGVASSASAWTEIWPWLEAAFTAGAFTCSVTGAWMPALAGCEGVGPCVAAASTTGELSGAWCSLGSL